MGAQIKAFILTFALFGLGAWFMLGKPALPNGFSFDKIKTYISALSSPKTESPMGKKSNAKRSASKDVGKSIDSYKGVKVYYNGRVSNVAGRNTTKDGYNLGLKYQCVEFAKRFYYEAYDHKMPDSYGHAKDYFDHKVADGTRNKARGMTQYRNDGPNKPKANDLCIIGPSSNNAFGHLFVVTNVSGNEVSFIQQNPGQRNPSRGVYKLVKTYEGWYIDCANLVGWLRL